MVDVNMISMNYENICGYLCFCCADAVDCGAASPHCMGGLDGWLGWVGMDRHGLGGLDMDEYG